MTHAPPSAGIAPALWGARPYPFRRRGISLKTLRRTLFSLAAVGPLFASSPAPAQPNGAAESPDAALPPTAAGVAPAPSPSPQAPGAAQHAVPASLPAEESGDFEVDAKAASATAAQAPVGAVTVAPIASPATGVTSTGLVDQSPHPPKGEVKLQPAVNGNRPIDISGYGQFQYESHADSADQLRQGGALLNQNRFSVRRMRLEVARRYQYSGYLVEIDANTSNGPAIGLHRAEGSLFYQGPNREQPTLLELTAGLLKLPFGYETPESSRSRWFMERTTASRAFFPNEVDVGARLHGGWRFLRYGVALTNGEPKGTKATTFQLQDPNAAKDVTLRIGAEVPLGTQLRFLGGISYLAGKGFSAGQDATKSRVVWNDNNQNGQVDVSQNELVGVPGMSAIPAQNFRRWAVGADLRLMAKTLLGWTTLFGEAVVATNLDRGLVVSDPIVTGRDLRQFGWHAGFTQEVSRYAIVGFRYDSYDPDSDITDSRGGDILPANQTISTYAPLVGLTLPERARLILEYDVVRDRLGRDRTGVPTDLANDAWVLRLQVSL